MFVFETANDHRLAMSLAVLSTYLKKIYPKKTFVIDDKKAVDKTFP
jgi:5-enolpyruvylshikimate-3-phosphate synthase